MSHNYLHMSGQFPVVLPIFGSALCACRSTSLGGSFRLLLECNRDIGNLIDLLLCNCRAQVHPGPSATRLVLYSEVGALAGGGKCPCSLLRLSTTTMLNVDASYYCFLRFRARKRLCFSCSHSVPDSSA